MLKRSVLLSLLCSATLLAQSDRVTIAVLGRFVQAGTGQVRVTCRVARHPDNRLLVIGIENYTSSDFQIEGENSRITFERWFTHIPCEATGAYCDLHDNHERHEVMRLSLTIVGCE